jgi:hypothetical protein
VQDKLVNGLVSLLLLNKGQKQPFITQVQHILAKIEILLIKFVLKMVWAWVLALAILPFSLIQFLCRWTPLKS